MQKQREENISGVRVRVLDVPAPLLGRPLADLASALADVYRATRLQWLIFGKGWQVHTWLAMYAVLTSDRRCESCEEGGKSVP